MNELDNQRRNNYIKKLVSNSRAILTNQITIPVGSQKMEKIIFWINAIKPIIEVDLKVFIDLNNQTGDYPIGTDRLSYEKNFLAKLDSELNPLVESFKDDIIKKCEEIIQVFGENRTAANS